MYISRLLVSGFKTQTSTPPNPGRNSCIVQLHVPGQGTTERIQMKRKIDKETATAMVKKIFKFVEESEQYFQLRCNGHTGVQALKLVIDEARQNGGWK